MMSSACTIPYIYPVLNESGIKSCRIKSLGIQSSGMKNARIKKCLGITKKFRDKKFRDPK
jgi:hypothetical protein